MSRIVILEEVLDKAANNPRNGYVLFGKQSQIAMAGELYDFIFHALITDKLDQIREQALFAVPVLGYIYPDEKCLGELDMVSKQEENSYLTRFAMVSKKPREYVDANGRKSTKTPFLKFYDINSKSSYKGLVEIPEQNIIIANNREMEDAIPNWNSISDKIEQIRLSLNENYSV